MKKALYTLILSVVLNTSSVMSWHSVWTTSYWPLGSYTSANVLDNAQEVYNKLTGAGWTRNATLAVIGNLCLESTGINPGQFEGGYNYSWSRGFGIGQWTPGTKVTDYIGSQAQGVADNGDRQLDFLLSEPAQYSTVYLNPDGSSDYYNLTGLPYISNMADFSQSTESIADLTTLWAICWERPGAQYLNRAQRITYATYFESQIQGDTPQTGYPVTVTVTGNGTARATPARAETGDTVTLTATPGAGETFNGYTVVSGGVTISGESFVMGNAPVVIIASFTGVSPIQDDVVYFPWLYFKLSNQWRRGFRDNNRTI